MKETASFTNSYKKFGNAMYVDHWHNAIRDAYNEVNGTGPLKNSDSLGKTIKLSDRRTKKGKPMYWLPAIQLEFRKLERLSINCTSDFFLFSVNGRFPKEDFTTVKQCERFARKRINKDYRIEIIEAYESLTYQRQGTNKWLLIEIGKGYA